MFSDTNWWYSKPPCSAFQEQQVNLKKIGWISNWWIFQSLSAFRYSWSVVGSTTSWFIYILYQNAMVPRRIIFPWKELLIYINSKMHFPGCYELLYTPLSGSTQPIWKTSHGSWNPKVHGEICAKSLQPPPIVLGYLHRSLHSPFTTRLQTSSNSTSTMSWGSRREKKILCPFTWASFESSKPF